MKAVSTLLIYALLLGCNADNSLPTKDSHVFIKPTTETYVISSPMEGVLMKDGQPLANTKIIRTLRWNDNEDGLTETFTTDEQGRFSLPIHEVDLTLGMLAQFVASVKLEAKIDGKIIDIWYNNKFEKGLNAETDGAISGLACELTAEEIVVETGLSKVMTICRWDNMPESAI